MADSTSPTHSPDILPTGTILKGSYEIVKYLGEGGAGCVYLAEHTGLGHQVAVKTLFGRFVRDEQMRRRFVEEGIIQANLNHKNIVRVSDIVDEKGFCAIIMEFVGGSSLDKALRDRKGPIDVREQSRIFCEILEGVAYAHAKEVVHRDIKPANILLSIQDDIVTPKLTDFGIAKILSGQRHTETGTAMGTIYYAPPEQLTDAKSVDHRADIYALGCTFFEMLSGKVPFNGDSLFTIMKQHIEAPRPDVSTSNPDVPRAISATLRRAMAIDPAQRYQTAGEFREAILVAWQQVDAGLSGALAAVPGLAPAPAAPAMPRSTSAGQTGIPRGPLPGDPLAAAAPVPAAARTNAGSAANPAARPGGAGWQTMAGIRQQGPGATIQGRGPAPNAAPEDRRPVLIVNGIIVVLALCVLGGIWMAVRKDPPPPAPTLDAEIPAADVAVAVAPDVAEASAPPPVTPDAGTESDGLTPAQAQRQRLQDCRALATRFSPYQIESGFTLGDAITLLETEVGPCGELLGATSNGTLLATTRVDLEVARIRLSLLELRALSAAASSLSPCSHAESATHQALDFMNSLLVLAEDTSLEPHQASEIRSFIPDFIARYARIHAAHPTCAIAPLPANLAPPGYSPPVNPNAPAAGSGEGSAKPM